MGDFYRREPGRERCIQRGGPTGPIDSRPALAELDVARKSRACQAVGRVSLAVQRLRGNRPTHTSGIGGNRQLHPLPGCQGRGHGALAGERDVDRFGTDLSRWLSDIASDLDHGGALQHGSFERLTIRGI